MNFSKRLWRTQILLTAVLAAIAILPLKAQTTDPTANPTEDQGPPPVAQTAQAPAASATAAEPAAITPSQNPDAELPGGKRIFGVLPNYRTADRSLENTTITAKQKLNIARKDTFDYPLVAIGGIFAGFGQLTNQNPSFGQGLEGFAHRWATGYADQAIGNLLSEGFYPVLLHEDPRYFRRGSGSVASRTMYALSRIIITKTDAGTKRFNYSEWFGNATAVAISNTYYPDGRTWGQNASKLVTQCATDGLSQVLKEFWPDIKKKLTHKN